jgi:hypothetical protein
LFRPLPQVGKMHFGYILGWTVVGSMLLWCATVSCYLLHWLRQPVAC